MYIYINIYLIIIYVNAHMYRCMPWEGFLPILKHMFGMCNWKSAPYTVGKHWAAKSVLHYRDPARCSWYKDEVRQDHKTYIAIRNQNMRRSCILIVVVRSAHRRSFTLI